MLVEQNAGHFAPRPHLMSPADSILFRNGNLISFESRERNISFNTANVHSDVVNEEDVNNILRLWNSSKLGCISGVSSGAAQSAQALPKAKECKAI